MTRRIRIVTRDLVATAARWLHSILASEHRDLAALVDRLMIIPRGYRVYAGGLLAFPALHGEVVFRDQLSRPLRDDEFPEQSGNNACLRRHHNK